MALVNHMAKTKKSSMGMLQKEDVDRNAKSNDENDDLDRSRTCLNYNISWVKNDENHVKAVMEKPTHWRQKVIDRVNALNLPRIRKDATYVCSFIISEESDFFDKITDKQKQQFFIDACKFYGRKYGYGNIVSAIVHMDETTPHMHLRLTPIKDGKLSARNLFSPAKMHTLQREFYKHMVSLGWEVGAPNFNNDKEHLNELNYKIQCANEELAKMQKELNNSKALVTSLKAQIVDLEKGKDKLTSTAVKMANFVNDSVPSFTDKMYELDDMIFELAKKEPEKAQDYRARFQKSIDKTAEVQREAINIKNQYERDR